VSRLQQLDADADDGIGSPIVGSLSLNDRVWSVAISPDDRSANTRPNVLKNTILGFFSVDNISGRH